MSAMTAKEVFTQRKSIAKGVFNQTLQEIGTSLDQRGTAERHQGNDNALFSPISTAVKEAYAAGELQLAIWLSEAAYKKAVEYEGKTGGQIHKGAITFDLALMYLAIDDFVTAMRYFEIAEAETRATESVANPTSPPSTFSLFRSRLFEINFWDRIDRDAKVYAVDGYRQFWGIDFDKVAAKDDWEKLSDNSKLLYLITVAQRMRYRQIAEEATWTGAASLHLAHWNLSADLGRVVETELKRKKRCPQPKTAITKPINTLGALLEQCFAHTTKPADLSRLQRDLHAHTHKVSDSPTFDAAFPRIRHQIEQGGTWDDRIANAVYLLRATRNQIAHSVDDSMVLFTDPKAAIFTVDVLLSLCRIEGWMN